MLDTVGEVRTNSQVKFSYGLLYIDAPVLVYWQGLIHTSSAQTLDAVLRTC